MIKNSNIEWTGPTWNPWQGCTKKSPGCKNCYMYREKRRWGQDPAVVVRSSAATFNKPLKLQREVEAGKRQGVDRLVFTCSWSDWFNPEANGWRDEAWDIVRRTPGLMYQVLTKLPERIEGNLPPYWDEIKSRIWLGASVENADYLWRAEYLTRFDPVVRFLSMEPMIGPVSLSDAVLDGIDWVIVGGESGTQARRFNPDWARQVRDDCARTDTAFFLKQMGTVWARESKLGGRSKAGKPDQWPEDLRVRQMPLEIEAAVV